jgi:hypothetical protein
MNNRAWQGKTDLNRTSANMTCLMILRRVGRPSRIRDTDEQSPDFEAGRVQPFQFEASVMDRMKAGEKKKAGCCSLLIFHCCIAPRTASVAIRLWLIAMPSLPHAISLLPGRLGMPARNPWAPFGRGEHSPSAAEKHQSYRRWERKSQSCITLSPTWARQLRQPIHLVGCLSNPHCPPLAFHIVAVVRRAPAIDVLFYGNGARQDIGNGLHRLRKRPAKSGFEIPGENSSDGLGPSK